MEAERGVDGGGAKTSPQSRSGCKARGAVNGVAEGCRAEVVKEDGEANREDRRGTGKDATEGRIEPCK